jgi:hypothetical protein
LNIGENSEVGMRLATLLSLGLNRRRKGKGRENGDSCSRRARASIRARNQGAEDTGVQSPNQHKA